MNNDLVRYSRAGDVFHYRWAARRCLNLIHPKSAVKRIYIEGSNEKDKAGEYVIDIAEYYHSKEVKYYQLKHTTVHKEDPFNLSELKDTFKGFADRFKETDDYSYIEFVIVTNRPINTNLKTFINDIVLGNKYNSTYKNNFLKYTELGQEDLPEFCKLIKFNDFEGDYSFQKYQLQSDISKLVPGRIDNAIIENVTSLIRDKALPDSDGCINKEDVLKFFGVTSERELFPAPVEFEKINRPIVLKQHEDIKDMLFQNFNPMIIHAAGGVGKTMFAREITEYPSNNYVSVIYDCFGGGRYRNRSELRHQHRIALVQIINELALKQLCNPLIVHGSNTDHEIMREFRCRIIDAVKNLKEINQSMNLLLVIDASDNAEMAAKEFNDTCFVSELLREDPIEGFKLIAICRTERISLLQPISIVGNIELQGFSELESLSLLQRKFSNAEYMDGLEFHRLTNGNPRVQNNALLQVNSIQELFSNLSDIGNTVDEQINNQLKAAVLKVKDKLSTEYQSQIDNICVGLATLPPFIPIKILSEVSKVEETTIKSFIAEIGKSLWLIDNAIQFRDEPTETWFTKNFVAEKSVIEEYVSKLKPYSEKFTYVSLTLPSLLLQAEKYNELINMALSEFYLPDNAIDKRNVKIFRLKFAFKAALKMQNFVDAIKIAFLAGEETAGDKRQFDLLRKNIDLINPLLNESYVQELSFKRAISGAWRGSENIYSASLLSTVQSYNGESRNYLRSGINWLRLYFEELKAREDEYIHNDVSNQDITELIYTYLNLYSPKKAISELLNWTPKEIHYVISKNIIRRLIDKEDYDLATDIAVNSLRNPYIIIAYVDEMFKIGKLVNIEFLEESLVILCSKLGRIKKVEFYDSRDEYLPSLLTFLEICLKNDLPTKKILRVLNYYFDFSIDYRFTENVGYYKDYRNLMLRKIALQKILSNVDLTDLTPFLSKRILESKEYDLKQKKSDIESVFSILLPWYELRLNTIIHKNSFIINDMIKIQKLSEQEISKRYKNYDPLPYEVIEIALEIIIISEIEYSQDIHNHINEHLLNNKFINIETLFKVLRASFRKESLNFIKYDVEEKINLYIENYKDIGVEEKAELYIDLARAIYCKNTDDASVYFNMAIEIVSKFGDEIVDRWSGIVSLAKCVGNTSEKDIPYRFIRCAELVGNNVAREKYWNRKEAIITCANLSLPIAISALSRWRDRDVGDFDYLLYSLLIEMTETKKLQSKYTWGLRSFLDMNYVYALGKVCIKAEPDIKIKQDILDDLIKYLMINGLIESEIIEEIKAIVETEQLIINGEMYKQKDNVVYKGNIVNTENVYTNSNDEKTQWEEIIQNIDLHEVDRIDEALKILDAKEWPRYDKQDFWRYVIKQIPNNKANDFLSNLIYSKECSIYDLKFVYSNLPNDWVRKVSLIAQWNQLIRNIGSKYATYFVIRGSIENFLSDISIDLENRKNLIEGSIGALANSNSLDGAEEFFGFISFVSDLIIPNSLIDVLDFGLKRFEIHIDDDFSRGDINYTKPKLPIISIKNSISGLILSALGSPNSEIRWRAVHSIKLLGELEAQEIFDELVNLITSDDLDLFVDIRFPLYKFHILQYLLIALQRVSIHNAQLLAPYVDFFSSDIIWKIPHSLINQYASRIIKNIELLLPGSFSQQILEKAEKYFIKKQQISKQSTSGIDELIEKNIVNKDFEFNHGYDMERYWFARLGKVFGFEENQITKLAKTVVMKYFNYEDLKDIRYEFGIYKYEDTHYDHNSYPTVDNIRFYISYHSMLIVSAILYDNMPVVQNDWYDDPWEDWLNTHNLTNGDKLWLSDYRDQIPYLQYNWGNIEEPEIWLEKITEEEFISNLLHDIAGETAVIVGGYWGNVSQAKNLSININSSLVDKASSNAILNALNSCDNPYDFKLPDYAEEDMELKLDKFNLLGWIEQKNKEKGIDEKDPFSSKVPYPPMNLGKTIRDELAIRYDEEDRKGISLEWLDAEIINEIWCKEGSEIYGNRMKVSFAFIKFLVEKLNKYLIVEVQIRKSYKENFYSRRESNFEYSKPKSRLFLFTGENGFRDSEKDYKIREKND